jgi:hypothetical protein
VSFGASVDQLKWALQSVVVDGRDLTDRPIEVGADARQGHRRHLHRSLAGDQRTLAALGGAPATDYSVVVFPGQERLGLRIPAIAIARPSSTGQFTFGGPGPASLASRTLS